MNPTTLPSTTGCVTTLRNRRHSSPSTQRLAQPRTTCSDVQKGIQTATNNFQPRIGMALDPDGDGKTVIRGLLWHLLRSSAAGSVLPGRCLGRLEQRTTRVRARLALSGSGKPGQPECVEIFQGLIPSASGSVASPCSPTDEPSGSRLVKLLAEPAAFLVQHGRIQLRRSACESIDFPEPELSQSTDIFCLWRFSRSVIRSQRISCMPTRNR